MKLYTNSGYIVHIIIGDQISFNILLIRSKQNGSRSYYTKEELDNHSFLGNMKGIVTEIINNRIYLCPSPKKLYPNEYCVNYVDKTNIKNIIVKKNRPDIDSIIRSRYILNIQRNSWRQCMEIIYLNLEMTKVDKKYEQLICKEKRNELAQLSDIELQERTKMLSEIPILTRNTRDFLHDIASCKIIH